VLSQSLQRIKDRHFYTETGNYTFGWKFPWTRKWCSGIPSERLAAKVENTAPRQELFCTAFDTALSKIEAQIGDNEA
jgi:hypothetical protein